ncbi:MAG: hypothetical protein J5I53_04415 [Bradyrhizobiaceae bacterium]|nr:hypothetical protein [Bradyrhizobiaceae bacterium]
MKSKDRFLIAFLLAFIIIVFVVFQTLLDNTNLSNFASNVTISVLGSVITITLMLILLQFQMRSEQEKDFRGRLFERKLDLYREFLVLIFSLDDDNVISKDEIQEVENKVGELSLVASSDLIRVCATVVVQLKSYGVLYSRSMTEKQLEHYRTAMGSLDDFVSLDQLVQAIRQDLSVVDGDVTQTIETYVGIPFDRFHMVKNPNVVD